MRYLFIVQGEGRGHMTQAISLERLLVGKGHEVVKILVGKSASRSIPDFFINGVSAPIGSYESMNFMPSAENRKPDMLKTVVFNSLELHRFFPSMRIIRDEIIASHADVVINFYELMAGMSYFFYEINIPMICIGHQYLFMHKDFGLPRDKYPGGSVLDLFSKLTAAGTVKHLALAFREMEPDTKHDIVVVPPLLRPEVLSLSPTTGNYIHGYMLNSGFSNDIMEWHSMHPDVELRFFWDNWNEGKIKKVDDTLSFYLIDDKEFLRQMAGCRAYASTAGFESICEAMWLQKPILMVPSHIEQEINAFDAVRAGAGISSENFDLTKLMEFCNDYEPSPVFKEWVRSAPELILKELEDI